MWVRRCCCRARSGQRLGTVMGRRFPEDHLNASALRPSGSSVLAHKHPPPSPHLLQGTPMTPILADRRRGCRGRRLTPAGKCPCPLINGVAQVVKLSGSRRPGLAAESGWRVLEPGVASPSTEESIGRVMRDYAGRLEDGPAASKAFAIGGWVLEQVVVDVGGDHRELVHERGRVVGCSAAATPQRAPLHDEVARCAQNDRDLAFCKSAWRRACRHGRGALYDDDLSCSATRASGVGAQARASSRSAGSRPRCRPFQG